MLKFDEQWQLDNVNGMLVRRPEIEKIADELFEKGLNKIATRWPAEAVA